MDLSQISQSAQRGKVKMGFFRKITETVFEVAKLPVDIVKDVITLGGTFDIENDSLTPKEKSYTRERIEKIADELDN